MFVAVVVGSGDGDGSGDECCRCDEYYIHRFHHSQDDEHSICCCDVSKLFSSVRLFVVVVEESRQC